MDICVNLVFLYEDETGKRMRIIHVEDKYAYYVHLSDKKSLPKVMLIDELEQQVKQHLLKEINDPFSSRIREEELGEEKKLQRDFKRRIVEEILGKNRTWFYTQKNKGKIISDIADKNNMSLDTTKRMLCQYWVRGMNYNALLDDYKNCGGVGKDRLESEGKKGRPHLHRNEVESSKLIGTNIDKKIKNIIEKVYKEQYLTKQKKTYRLCYQYMIYHYFSDETIENDETEYILWDGDKIPSYQQFIYWCKKIKNDMTEYIGREGERAFQLNKRSMNDTPDNYVFGPGSRYEVDATIADIYIESEIVSGNVIGRPTIYIVIDVFSRLIVGVYVGLEGPSWVGVMMALDNVVEDKVEFCARHGIKIKEKDWSNSYLPQMLIADNGEFEGYNVENLINNLNVTVSNLPCSRGDLKPIVERKFRQINDMIKQTAPGTVRKRIRDRGEKPYSLEARLTLADIRKHVIYIILDHNQSMIEKYERIPAMLSDNVLPIPNELWKWGMKNRRTAMFKRDRKTVRLNLMPSGVALITRKGIKFKSRLFYTCDKAVEEQWFISKQGSKLNIVYDPRNLNNVYIINKKSDNFLICKLTNESKKYENISLHELEELAKLDRAQKKEYEYRELQQKVNKLSSINALIEEANENHNESSISYRKRQQQIRENRHKEKMENRQVEYFNLNEVKENDGKRLSYRKRQVHENEEYEAKSHIDLLRKLNEEDENNG